MTLLAPTLEAFFTQRLIGQRHASPNTITSYRDTFRLLLTFARARTGRPPSRLNLEDLDAPLIAAFLGHLETERHNGARTRNARLAAVHSLFRFAALTRPEHAELIARVLAIQPKRADRTIVTFLTTPRSTRYSPHPTAARGSDGATTPYCCLRSRPGCASPSSPHCAAPTSTWSAALTSAARARAASNASRR